MNDSGDERIGSHSLGCAILELHARYAAGPCRHECDNKAAERGLPGNEEEGEIELEVKPVIPRIHAGLLHQVQDVHAGE